MLLAGCCCSEVRLRLAALILSLVAREAGVIAGGDVDASSPSSGERLDAARRLLAESPLIDGHNDLPWNIRKFVHNQLKEFNFAGDLKAVAPWSRSPWSHTDLKRLRKGMVGGQFWVAYVPCESQNLNAVQLTLEQIDLIKRLIDKYQQHMQFASSTEQIVEAHNARRIASLIGVEGGHSIGNSLAILRILYDLGVRYMTLTHTCDTPWAHSSAVEHTSKPYEKGGLTNFGKAVVGEMNRLGMMVDLSHAAVATMRDALAASSAPVIFSHSSAFSLCNSSRNVPDAVLRELAANGGLVMVTFYNFFVKCGPTATVADVAEHINYIRNLIGVDHIGVGGDFDGINRTPQGLEDVSMYPELFAELLRSSRWTLQDLKKLSFRILVRRTPQGLEDVSMYPELFAELLRSSRWTLQDLKKVAGLNLLRVFGAVERVRDQMKHAGVAPSEDYLKDPVQDGSKCVFDVDSASGNMIC